MAGNAMHRWIHGSPRRAAVTASFHGTGGLRSCTAGWSSSSKIGRRTGRKKKAYSNGSGRGASTNVSRRWRRKSCGLDAGWRGIQESSGSTRA
eukprot:3323735-Alexandrium_andersonii.AAC.1